MRAFYISIFLALSACNPLPGGFRAAGSPGVALSVRPIPDVLVGPLPPAGKADPRELEFKVRCGAGYCPDQVGLLAFVKNDLSEYIQCTASLIAEDSVVSSGHCARGEGYTGYFVTSKLKRKIAGTVFKNEEPESLVLKLDRPVPPDEVRPFTLASGAIEPLEKLHLFALVHSKDLEFEIVSHECELARHEAWFPYSLFERPDIITTFGCDPKNGNSGGPLLAAPDDLVVQAIHNESLSVEEREQLVKRELKIYERHNVAYATNAHCLGWPEAGAACVRASREESQSRFSRMVRDKFARLNLREFKSETLGFRALPYQLSAPEYEFEIHYQPRCRKGELKSLAWPMEHVVFEFDAWGKVSVISLALLEPEVTIVSTKEDSVSLRVAWPAPFGQLLDERVDSPRAAGAAPFSIAIPRCAR